LEQLEEPDGNPRGEVAITIDCDSPVFRSNGMKAQYRDIIKHSGVYGVGQILTRLASILLLPLYTRYLAPADYGTIAILDLTVSVMGILIGGGMAAAVSRYHFESEDTKAQNEVWWTGLTVVVATATLIVAPALMFRLALAKVTLGPAELAGRYYYALMLPTLWFGAVAQVPDQYLRIRKWSWLTVAFSLGGLLLNIALNVYFLAVMHMGVAGVLWGNLLTGIVMTSARFAVLAVVCWPFSFRKSLAVDLWSFGSPIVMTGLLATIMHQADRYLLRLFVDLGQVGIYSLAYTVGQGLNTMCLAPFAAVWTVVMYEIAKHPDAKWLYAQVFEYFVYALLLLVLGVSLFVQPLLSVLVSPEYAAAGRLIPIVCLAFVFFAIHEHFKVPALLAKRTVSLLPAYAAAAVANVLLNLTLIPVFGVMGAAWTSVATYAVFSTVGLLRYRRIDRLEYPLAKCGGVLLAMTASYVGCQYLATLQIPVISSLVVPTVVWCAWAVVLLHSLVRRQGAMRAQLAMS
jgi:O-antigen/teichoic acid export membrane protein